MILLYMYIKCVCIYIYVNNMYMFIVYILYIYDIHVYKPKHIFMRMPVSMKLIGGLQKSPCVGKTLGRLQYDISCFFCMSARNLLLCPGNTLPLIVSMNSCASSLVYRARPGQKKLAYVVSHMYQMDVRTAL